MAIEYVFVVCRAYESYGTVMIEYFQDPMLAVEGMKEFSIDKSRAMVFAKVKDAVRVAEATGGMARILLDSERSKFGGASESSR